MSDVKTMTPTAAEASNPESQATPSATAGNEGQGATPKESSQVSATTPEAAKAAGEGAKTEGESAKAGEASLGEETVVPEKYDLKLPDEAGVSASEKAKFEAWAKAQGLSNAEAQAELEARLESQRVAVEEQKQEWLKAAQEDSEIGGDKFAEHAELAKRGTEKFFPELVPLLEKTGLGNHPDVIRGLARIGKLLGNDRFVEGAPPTEGRSLAERLYGSPKGRKG